MLGTDPRQMEAVQWTGGSLVQRGSATLSFPYELCATAELWGIPGTQGPPQLAQPESQQQPPQPPQTRQHPRGWKTGHRDRLKEPTGQPRGADPPGALRTGLPALRAPLGHSLEQWPPGSLFKPPLNGTCTQPPAPRAGAAWGPQEASGAH